MKSIIAISGSANENSSNTELLKSISLAFQSSFEIGVIDGLWKLPLFSPQKLKAGIPSELQALKNHATEADAVIISTPEYLHNIPAVLKNILEWMTESGELAGKPVLAITFTPASPRGEFAMKSLLESLKASKAKVVAELPLYQNQLRSESGKIELDEESKYLVAEALKLL